MATKKKRTRKKSRRKANPAPRRRRRHVAHAAPRRHKRRRHNPAHLFGAKRRSHKRRSHKRRRNPDSAIKDLAFGILGGAVAGIAIDLGLKKFGSSLTAQQQQIAKVAAGGAAGFFLNTSNPALGLGIAVGVAAPAVRQLVQPYLPAQLQGFDDPDLSYVDAYAQMGGDVRQLEAVEDLGAVEGGYAPAMEAVEDYG